MSDKKQSIELDHITKIEGHADLNIKIEEGKVKKVELAVFEGARFFESIIKGRAYNEVPLLVSRVCGICSCIHNVASVTALEEALGVTVSEQTNNLRELMCLGERIRSHVTHLYFLALPDYLGYESAIAMSKVYRKEVDTALKLMKLGNDLVSAVAGRDLHPVTNVVGGFSRLPEKKELEGLLEQLKEHRQDFVETAGLFAKLDYPDFERRTHYFSIEKYGDYFRAGGRMSCFGEYCLPTDNYEEHIREYLQPYSTAKFAVLEGKSYMVGSLARLNNNFDSLNDTVKKLIDESKYSLPSYNPFLNNLAQALELVDNVDRAIECIKCLDLKREKPVEVKAREGHAVSAVEAPRGTLFHEYTLNSRGEVEKANIVTPTAQNLRSIEDDIREFLPDRLNKSRDEIVTDLEKLIRSYDPCISCSTHFLEVKFE